MVPHCTIISIKVIKLVDSFLLRNKGWVIASF